MTRYGIHLVSGALAIAFAAAAVHGAAQAAGETAPSVTGEPQPSAEPRAGQDRRSDPDASQVESKPASPPQSQGTEGSLNAQAQLAMAEQMLDKPLVDGSGNEIGEVDDVLLDTSDRPAAVIVSSGGFFGIGGKEVALSWSEVSHDPAAEVVRADTLSQERFEQLSEYEKTGTEISLRERIEGEPAADIREDPGAEGAPAAGEAAPPIDSN